MLKVGQKRLPRLPRQTTLFMVVLFVVATIISIPIARAATIQTQINELNNENAQNKQQLSLLETQADSFQDAINKLQSEINSRQARINENQLKNDELQKQISEAELELAKQKDLLGKNIKAMYLEGDISTIEMLATSKDLSDYFNKQQYRDVVKSKIKTTLEKVTALKAQLKTQKEEVEKIIKEQEELRAQAAAQKAEQDRLLGLNQADQSTYDRKIKDNASKISELRRLQAIENARLFGGGVTNVQNCGPDYPAYLCNRAMDSMVDPWGMYNRECVSYVAYMVANDGIGGGMPYWGGRGNAWQWGFDGWAAYAGRYQTYTSSGSFWHTANAKVDGKQYINPDNLQRGDVAVKNGTYGHVMYIESVNSDGTINISQFNHDWNGRYSEAYNVSTSGLVFLRF